MLDATGVGGFVPPDLTSFCRLDGLGLVVIGQRVTATGASLWCAIVEADRWCRDCGAAGGVYDHVTRRLAHEPFGWRPTTLVVTVRDTAASPAGGCGVRT